MAIFVALLLARPAWAQSSGEHAGSLAIVGEGPVGLLAAIEARRAGVADVTIYEARAEGRPGRQQTPMLDQPTVDMLRKAGVDLHALTPIHTKTITTESPYHGTRTTTVTTSGDDGHWSGQRFESVGLITTGDLEVALRNVATKLGVKVVYDTEVRSAKNAGARVELEVGARTRNGEAPLHGEKRQHGFVVFADGSSGLGARFAQREVVSTMPMVGALTTKQTGENHVVRFADVSSGELVSVSLLGTGQVLAQLPRRLAAASPADKQHYLEQHVSRLGLRVADLGARLNFNGELAHGSTGEGHIFVVGDASGAVPVVTSANLAIHMPLAANVASTIAAVSRLPKESRAAVLEKEHGQLTAELRKNRTEVTSAVLPRMTPARAPIGPAPQLPVVGAIRPSLPASAPPPMPSRR